MKKYAKALVAFGAAVGVLGAALMDGSVSAAELAQVLIAFGAVGGVFGVTNTPA